MPPDGAERITAFIASRCSGRRDEVQEEIIRANDNDADALAELLQCLWGEHSREELISSVRQYTGSEDSAVFAMETSCGFAGVAVCSLRRDYVEGCGPGPVGYLEGICVREDRRGQGIGRRLAEKCEHWAREKGCAEFASDCELDNVDSLAFHLHIGFQEANRIICFRKALQPSGE